MWITDDLRLSREFETGELGIDETLESMRVTDGDSVSSAGVGLPLPQPHLAPGWSGRILRESAASRIGPLGSGSKQSSFAPPFDRQLVVVVHRPPRANLYGTSSDRTKGMHDFRQRPAHRPHVGIGLGVGHEVYRL